MTWAFHHRYCCIAGHWLKNFYLVYLLVLYFGDFGDSSPLSPVQVSSQARNQYELASEFSSAESSTSTSSTVLGRPEESASSDLSRNCSECCLNFTIPSKPPYYDMHIVYAFGLVEVMQHRSEQRQSITIMGFPFYCYREDISDKYDSTIIL